MAIQRMYTGRGGAVVFDRPSITPTEISQQYGRSMTDILKYKQTMQQRRKENLLEMTKFGDIGDVVEEDREVISAMMEKTMQTTGGILQASEGAKDYDFSREDLSKVQTEMTRFETETGAILSGRQQQLKAIGDLQANEGDFDWEASMAKIEEFNKTRKVPKGGFLVAAPVNTAALIYEASKDVREVDTDEYTSKDVGDSIVILRGKAYNKKDIEMQAKMLSGKSRAQKALFEEYGGTEGIAKAIEESLAPLSKEKIAAHKKKEEDEDVSKISSKENVIINKGVPHTITGASGTEGKGSFDISESWSVTHKGKAPELRVDATSYIVQSGQKAAEEGLGAGQTVAEAKVEASDRTYEVEKQEIQKRRIYEGDDITVVIRKKRIAGEERWYSGKVKQDIKGGDPVSKEAWAAMSPEQQDRSGYAPVVVSHLKDAVYGTFTIMDKLDSRMANELGLSPEFVREVSEGESPVGFGASNEGIDSILQENKNVPFIKRMLQGKQAPVRKNEDGTESSHLMSWGESNGKYIAFPSLVYKGGKWEEPNNPMEAAIKSKNYITFDTQGEAEEFAAGSWKKSSYVTGHKGFY